MCVCEIVCVCECAKFMHHSKREPTRSDWLLED